MTTELKKTFSYSDNKKKVHSPVFVFCFFIFRGTCRHRRFFNPEILYSPEFMTFFS